MSKQHNRRGVVICGAYGLGNAGDDAVLSAIAAGLRRIDRDMPITVLARRPKETARRFGVRAIHPLRLLRWLAALRRARLFISGGGSLLQDVTSRRSLWYYLGVIRLARRAGCAVQLYGCGVGPLRSHRCRRMTAQTLNACADVITVRDTGSQALLARIGVTEPRIVLAADPLFSLVAASDERERRFGVALRPWPALSDHAPELADIVRYVYETYRLEPVFFSLGPGDRAEAARVCALLGDIPFTVSIDARRMGRMSLVLSMRLHGLIFALLGGAPAAGISYDPKVSAFCRDAHLPYAALPELTDAGLRRMIDEAAHLDAEQLSADRERLHRRERGNIAAAAELLSTEEPAE